MRNILQGTALGALLGWVFVTTLGYTMAISAPKSLFELMSIGDSPIVALIVWDFFIVHGLGIGVLLAATGYALARLIPDKAIMVGIVTCVSVWLTVQLGYDIATIGTIVSPFNRAWWQYGFEFMLVLGMFAPIVSHAKWGKDL